MKKQVYIFLIWCFLSMLAFSQTAKLQANLIIQKPTSPSLADWKQNASVAQLIITNLSGAPINNVYVSFTFKNLSSNQEVAHSVNSYARRFSMPVGTKIRKAEDVLPNDYTNGIWMDATFKTVLYTTGKLPEGTYQMCAHINNEQDQNISGADACDLFTIVVPMQPRLISPNDTNMTIVGLPVFNWTPVMPLPPGADIKYELKIVPVFEGQSGQDAMDRNDSLARKTLITPFYQYLPGDAPFTTFKNDLKYYAWQVRAYDANNIVTIQNQGKSEIGYLKMNNLDAPILLSPMDTNIVIATPPMFSWNAINPPFGTFIRYNLRVVPVMKGQSASSAMKGVTTLLDLKNLTTPFYQSTYSDSIMTRFADAPYFAWQVRAVDQDGQAVTKNDGYSGIKLLKITRSLSPENFRDTSSILITANTPLGEVKYPDPPKPPFSVIVTPPINASAITTSTLSVWKQTGGGVAAQSGKSGTPVFTYTFKGSDATTVKGASYGTNSTLLEIIGVNQEGGSSKSFIPDTGCAYIWTVSLSYLPDKIRADGKVTAVGGKTSDDGIFTARLAKTDSTVIQILALTPSGTILYPDQKQPAFSVSVNPPINTDAISGATFSIWKMAAATDSAAKVKLGTPVFTKVLNTNDKSIIKLNHQTKDTTYLDLAFIDSSVAAKKFLADSGYTYLWNFTLNYQKDKIRQDSNVCMRTSQVSNDAIFVARDIPDTTMFSIYPGLPITEIKYPDEKAPKFSAYVSPLINKTAIKGGALKLWVMSSADEDPVQVRKRKPDSTFTFTGNGDNILKASEVNQDSLRLDLVYLNGDSTATKTAGAASAARKFIADSGKVYLWALTLNYDKTRIRRDGVIPLQDNQTSSNAVFRSGSESGACVDNCSTSAPTNTTPNPGSFAAGNVIRVGKFQMKVITASGFGNGLTGTGSIKVPYLRAPVLVKYNNIKVNTNNQFYDGEIDAAQSAESPVTDEVANHMGSSLGLTNDQINNLHAIASSATKLVSAFTGTEPVGLPIGFDNTINGEQVVVGVVGMVWTPTNAKLNAAISVPVPQLGPGVGIGLGASDICFHPGGIGGDGNATLYLASDFGYNSGSSGDSWSMLFKARTDTDTGTFVSFDCHGFKKFQVAMEVKFPRAWVVPDADPTGNGQVKARVTAQAEKKSGSWQWLGDAKIDKCQIPAVPGLKIEFQDVAFDYSSIANPPGIVFPSGFKGSTKQDWTGFFVKRAAVTLPDELRPLGSSQPLQVSMNNVIIGKTGVNFSFRLENLLKYPQADFGGWEGSIDTLAIDVVNSSLQKGSLIGKIHVPLFDSSFVYSATLSAVSNANAKKSLGYQFVIAASDSMRANLWYSTLMLEKTSKIEISNATGKFVASAVLNGQLSIAGNVGKIKGINFKEIKFQNFKIQSVAPYIDKGTWSFASPQKSMNGFPISINDIEIKQATRGSKPALGLKFNVGVQFAPGANAFGGSTTLCIWGVINESGQGQRFAFDGVELDSIGINASLGIVEIKGGVRIYDGDPTYGDGFSGAIQANFARQLMVKATAQFGSVNNYRYWYVDASVAFSTGIPMGQTGVGFYGFGGGAWYHMRKTGVDPSLSNLPKSANPKATSTPGVSNSGYVYVPDNNVLFGFKAMVILGTYPRPESFNCDVAMEAQFLTDGGIKSIGMNGQGYMLITMDQRDKARIKADVDITFDFQAVSLHGVFNAYILAAPAVSGRGTMVFHVDPKTWYMRIGEPSSRVSLNIAGMLNVNGYFMLGKDLPAIPLPPNEVLSRLTAAQKNALPTSRDKRVATGDGIAFGGSVSFNTGRQTFAIFYGQVSAGGGFDMAMFKQTKCPGFNGWQGQGQFYAYMLADIGLYVDVGFWTYKPCGPWYCWVCRWCQANYIGYRGDFKILYISGAALLQVGGPNPWWAKGTVTGQYNILGGLVKGSCNYSFSKGTICTL